MSRVDGQLRGCSSVDGPYSSSHHGVRAWRMLAAGASLGRGQYAGSVAHHWCGDIDDVRVFRGVLSQPQIAYLASL